MIKNPENTKFTIEDTENMMKDTGYTKQRIWKQFTNKRDTKYRIQHTMQNKQGQILDTCAHDITRSGYQIDVHIIQGLATE